MYTTHTTYTYMGRVVDAADSSWELIESGGGLSVCLQYAAEQSVDQPTALRGWAPMLFVTEQPRF